MRQNRTSRFISALITVISLLFTQMAVAAYACPKVEQDQVVSSQTTMAMPGCPGMDDAEPALCNAHCDGPRQAVDAPASPILAPFMAAAITCVLPERLGNVDYRALATAPPSWQHATAPPITIRNCCFRI